MRKYVILLLLSLSTLSSAQTVAYRPTPENLKARKEFSDSRFGIVLHWGLYSLFGQGEWYMTTHNIDHKEYAKAAQAFYPHRFDAQAWVSAVKEARNFCLGSCR